MIDPIGEYLPLSLRAHRQGKARHLESHPRVRSRLRGKFLRDWTFMQATRLAGAPWGPSSELPLKLWSGCIWIAKDSVRCF